MYKPMAGDVVDEMFASYLNKAKLTIEVQRISASNYMFGTKKILAKIINGRLVIRVGGGYMNAEEFIEQYGKIEMMKMMRMEESKNAQGGYNSEDKAGIKVQTGASDIARKSAMGAGADFKDKLKQSLMKVTPYQTLQTNKDNNLASSDNAKRKQSLFGIEKSKSGVDSDSELKSALEGVKSTFSVSKLNFGGVANTSP
jgi:hypothetical protein